jgi:hypothetical protein
MGPSSSRSSPHTWCDCVLWSIVGRWLSGLGSGEVLVSFTPMSAVSLHRRQVLLDNDAFGKLDFLCEESSAKAQG